VQARAGVFDPLRPGDPVAVGGYRLRARLGAGGMGLVYLSFTAGGRALAVKVLRREIADDIRSTRRFAREVRAAELVTGPFIAPVVDAAPDGDPPWLATAYVAGPTVERAVKAVGALAPDAAKLLMGSVARALDTIHGAGVVHRDLKPGNVVLGPHGPRVIDFGIAKISGGMTLTEAGKVMGTTYYIAPECFAGQPATPAADLFALGVLASYAATGREPFDTGDGGPVYQGATMNPDLTAVPASLRPLIEACLAASPADRPSAAEVAAACLGDATALPPPRQWLPQRVVRSIEARRSALARLAEQHSPPLIEHDATPDAEHEIPPVGSWRAPARSVPRQRRPRARSAVLWTAAVGVAVAAGSGAAVAIDSLSAPRTQDAPTFGATGASALSPVGPGPQGPPPGGPPPGGPMPDPAQMVVRWKGTVRIDQNGLGLDTVPPVYAAPGAGNADVREAAPASAHALATGEGGSILAPLPAGAGTPTAVLCADAVTAHGTAQLHVTVGETVCVRTDRALLVALTITGFPPDGSGATADATVWGPDPSGQGSGPPP
jgi:serine/threonine protein kinase